MLSTLQVGRGLCALLVMAFHINGTMGLAKYYGEEPLPIARMGYAGVDFFFVLSGFLLTTLHQQQFGQPSNAHAFFRKRFLRIFPTYWIVTLPIMGVMAFGVAGTAPSIYELAASFLLLPYEGGDILAVGWTLKHEILFYALFGTLIFSRRLGVALLGAWFILSGLAAGGLLELPRGGILFAAHNLLFLFGIVAALAAHAGKLPYPRVLTGVGIAGFFATGLFSLNSSGGGPVLTLLYGVFSAVAVAAATTAETEGRIASPKPLVQLGDASYALYLIHFPLISALLKLVVWTGLDVLLPPLAAFTLIGLIVVAISLGFHVLVERQVLRLLDPKRGRPKAGAAIYGPAP